LPRSSVRLRPGGRFARGPMVHGSFSILVVGK
jgi:hypothetical protein